jgi:site-specific recombinase XerD
MEYLVGERNLARNTQVSYRDTLTLLLPFVAKISRRSVDRLCILDITPDIVRAFLKHLEQDRGCSFSTRNQRLAAIHALAKFIGEHSPEHIAWCTEICMVPFKKTSKPSVSYLDKPEMDAILSAPDRKTVQGFRDHTLLLFLYNTGARADEAVRVVLTDLSLHGSLSVWIMGKGGKRRLCPLWPSTVNSLQAVVTGRNDGDPVFLNCRGQAITRFGIYSLVKRYVFKAAPQMPSLSTKQVSPHTIRHTTAVHLLRAGVDINTIRAWLGHVSLDTTNIYAEVDLEMKAKALAHCEIEPDVNAKHWNKQPDVMSFLKSL